MRYAFAEVSYLPPNRGGGGGYPGIGGGYSGGGGSGRQIPIIR